MRTCARGRGSILFRMDPNILINSTIVLEQNVSGLVETVTSSIIDLCELEESHGLRSGSKRPAAASSAGASGPVVAAHVSKKAKEVRSAIKECLKACEVSMKAVTDEAAQAQRGGIVLKNKEAPEYEEMWISAARNQTASAVAEIKRELASMAPGNAYRM